MKGNREWPAIDGKLPTTLGIYSGAFAVRFFLTSLGASDLSFGISGGADIFAGYATRSSPLVFTPP
jgi:hypothetical protein